MADNTVIEDTMFFKPKAATDPAAIPPIDRTVPSELSTATFAMG